MSKRRAPEKNQMPADKTQAMNLLPPELSMLEPPPPIGEDSTQALPLLRDTRGDESEILSILGGPEATMAMKVGAPAPEKQVPSTPDLAASTEVGSATQVIHQAGDVGSGTQVIPRSSDVGSGTQVIPRSGDVGSGTQVIPSPPPAGTAFIRPSAASPTPMYASTQVMPPGAPRPLPPPGQIHIPGRRGLPGWVWAGLAGLVILGGLGGLALVRPELLGLGAPDANAEGSPAPSAENPEPGDKTEPKASEPPTQEIPPALRSYYDKAQRGDPSAMRTLGVMYYYGMNVPKNTEEGIRWYRKAAEAGSQAAKKDLKALEGLK